MPEPVSDIDELSKAIENLERQFANCSTREERDRLKGKLQKDRAQLGAKVAEVQQALEHRAKATAEAGDQALAEELRQAADKLAEIASRRAK